MKRILILSLVLIMTFSINAQTKEKGLFKRFSFELYGGIPIAYTDIKNEFFGYNGTARLNWFATSAVALGGEFSYGNVIGQDDNYKEDYFINTYMKAMLGGDIYFFNTLKFYELSSWFQPFAGVNVGAVKSNIELSGNKEGLNDIHYNNWDFAHQWHIGTKIKLSKWIDLNSRYSIIFITSDNFDNNIPKTPLNKYNDVLTNVDLGLTFHLGSKGKNSIIWNPATVNKDEFATKESQDSLKTIVKSLDEKLKTTEEDLINTTEELAETKNNNNELEEKVNILNERIDDIGEKQSNTRISNAVNSISTNNPSDVNIHLATLNGPLNALYYIISGSYEYKKHANNRVQELRNLGYDPVIMNDNASNLKRVVVESSDDLEYIKLKLQQHRRDLDPSAWIIQQVY